MGDRQCRTCLDKQRKLLSINNNIARMIQDVTQIQVSVEDGLSRWVCSKCVRETKKFYGFKKMCLDSYKILKEVKSSQCFVNIKKEEPHEEDRIHIEIKFEPSNSGYDVSDAINFDDDRKDVDDFSYKFDDRSNSEDDLNDTQIKTIFACPYCHAPFINTTVFYDHVEVTHPDKKNDNAQMLIDESTPLGYVHKNKYKSDEFKCFCGDFTTVEYPAFLEHFKVHNDGKSVTCPDKPFSCTMCDYTCRKKTTLRLHLHSHSNEKKYHCAQCTLTFRWASALSRHKAAVHDKKRNHTCHMCEKKFFSLQALKVHSTVHTKEKPHVCHICGTAFTQIANLIKHVTAQHESEEVSRKYKCNLCDFTCKYATNYSRHMDKHAGIKNYKCDQCPFLTNSSSSLKLHIMRHNGEPQFACDLCDYKCLQRSTLKVHRLVHTKEKNFSCDLCTYRGGTISALKKHKETHSTELKYSCPHCSFKTNVRDSLTRHMRKNCQPRRRESKPNVRDILPSAFIPEFVFNDAQKEMNKNIPLQ